MRVTANDCMSPELIDEVYYAQDGLRQLFMDLLSRPVALAQPDTSASVYTIPFPDLINTIERNLDALSANGYKPGNMKPSVSWLGELNDLRRLDYTDVNRWFESVELITDLAWAVSYRGLITGNYSSGSDRTRQTLRTVN